MEAAASTETSVITYQTRPRRWQCTISRPWKPQIRYNFHIVCLEFFKTWCNIEFFFRWLFQPILGQGPTHDVITLHQMNYTIQSGESKLTFRGKMSLPSSWSKKNPSKKPAWMQVTSRKLCTARTIHNHQRQNLKFYIEQSDCYSEGESLSDYS